MFDLIIKNGRIIDGTGKDAYEADLAVKDGKVCRIGNLDGEEAERVFDASGCVVSPGFIDPHSHADLSLLVWPKNEAYAKQGVTTQIAGNCGLAPAPFNDDIWEFWCWEYSALNKSYKRIFEPYNFQTSAPETRKALKEVYGLDVTWKTLGEFMDLAEEKGFCCNYYPQSGHNHIRNAVMGDAKRPATEEELEQMKAILRDDMEHGSQGFSTGLDYEPGRNADHREVEELVRVAGEYGGVYSTHTRNFDPEHPDGSLNLLYGVREATDLCRETGVKTNISHMCNFFDVFPYSEEMEKAGAEASVAELERGWREEGLPMMYDVISSPDMGGSTTPYLASVMRPFILLCGGADEFLKKVEYPDFVELMREQVAAGKYAMLAAPSVPPMLYIYGCKEKAWEGKNVAELMKEWKMDIVDAFVRILKTDMYTTMEMKQSGGQEMVKILLSSERAMPSSDGFAFDSDTEFDFPKPLNRRPHPNNYSFAVRYLMNYGPERLEDKIRQMTAVPAEWFNIHDRGTLEEGKWADIVVLKPEELAVHVNPADLGEGPDGIEYVFINGELVVDHKVHTGALPGKVLRREGYKK